MNRPVKDPKQKTAESPWTSPIPEERWRGFRRVHRGVEAFSSLENFEAAQKSELEESLSDAERQTLGRLLKRGKKTEIEVFLRTHGANPVSDPAHPIDTRVGIAHADRISLTDVPDARALDAIRQGHLLHMLFQAGDATRFKQGPLYRFNPLHAVKGLSSQESYEPYLKRLDEAKKKAPKDLADFLLELEFGPKQAFLIRAGLRRVIQQEIEAGRVSVKESQEAYQAALKNQKLLFFVTEKDGLGDIHFEFIKEKFNFFGFDPTQVVTVAQQLVRGLTMDENGAVDFVSGDSSAHAAGHLYALLQAARPDFTFYTESGRPAKSRETDGLAYLIQRGAKYFSVIRINDMDRHSTEIVNAKALSFALKTFDQGYVNVIEGVANPTGQKGGTGTTFDDPDVHVLTETHENSYPVLARAFEQAFQKYVAHHAGAHPAYNAMRQIGDLSQTRRALREAGGRIVFVPRERAEGDESSYHLGVDMPMGDLSLLHRGYKSRMFQFVDASNRELNIHDMKVLENFPMAILALEKQLQDPFVLAAAEEFVRKKPVAFKARETETTSYGAAAPEFA